MEELWGLTSFFGYSTQTFVQAVNLLDRFLTTMKVKLCSNLSESVSFTHSTSPLHRFASCILCLTETFTHAGFLPQVQPKHLPCIGVGCLHIAAKMVEAETDVSPTHELIRISQSRFTVSDLCRMEKIISEKLSVQPEAVTALTFLHLYYSAIAGRSAFVSFSLVVLSLPTCGSTLRGVGRTQSAF